MTSVNLPKNIISNIFKYLPSNYISIKITKYMNDEDIKYMLNQIYNDFHYCAQKRLFTACVLIKKYNPKFYQRVDWNWISVEYPLSKGFIKEFVKYLHPRCFIWYKYILEEYANSICYRIPKPINIINCRDVYRDIINIRRNYI